MYRETPESPIDSGWRFFSGEESQAYADHADNFAMYDINTIANYDPTSISLLDSPPGCAYARNADGDFDLEPVPPDPDA